MIIYIINTKNMMISNSPILSQTELNQKARPTAETVKYQRGVGAEIPHACEE